MVYGVILAVGLCYYLVIVNRFRIIRIRSVCDCQGSVYVRDLVSLCDVIAGCICDLRAACHVLAASDQGLASAYCHGRDLVAVCQLSACQLISAVGQGAAVIDFLVACCCDGDLDWCGLNYYGPFGFYSLAIRIFSCCYSCILDRCCFHITWLYNIGCSQFFGSTWLQCEFVSWCYPAGKRICYLNVTNSQVSCILYNDRIVYSLTIAVSILISCLCYADRSGCWICINCCLCCLGEISKLCSNGINKASCQDVSLCNGISSRCLDRCAACYIFKCCLSKGYTIDFLKGDRSGFFINIGCCDYKSYFVAKFICLIFLNCFGNNQARINWIVTRICSVGYCKSSIYIFYLVISCLTSVCTNNFRFTRYIVAAANQSL